MRKVIKIKEDNTAAEVEILIHLSRCSDKLCTACETVAPGCVIEDNKTTFIGVLRC
jgi:hypothetical protein